MWKGVPAEEAIATDARGGPGAVGAAQVRKSVNSGWPTSLMKLGDDVRDKDPRLRVLVSPRHQDTCAQFLHLPISSDGVGGVLRAAQSGAMTWYAIAPSTLTG